jgi:hypothetical protein
MQEQERASLRAREVRLANMRYAKSLLVWGLFRKNSDYLKEGDN